ncbi:MAG: DegT/DnrJ/EryC1/StrS family aminotransferase, partial [Myxococcota bacterium]
YIYVVRHPQRDRIMEALKDVDIRLNISYPYPIHLMTGFRHLGMKVGDLPHTERAANEIFSLPMYPYLRVDDQARVIHELRRILASL